MTDTSDSELNGRTVTVRFDEDTNRFLAEYQGEPTGARLYAEPTDEGIWNFTSTQVPDELEGRGIASALVRQALEHVAARDGETIRPTCSYVGAWIRRHPEWMKLVHPRFRSWLEPRAGSGPDEDGVGGDDDGGSDGGPGDGGGSVAG